MMIRTPMAALAAGVALSLSLSLPLAAQEHPEGLHVHDVYARSNGQAGGSGAVFFMIHNNTATDDRLIAARADVAERVELHTHIEDANGVMQMREVEGGIALPAGEMHALERGGDHVMLMGLTEALEDGQTFPVTLTFEQAGDVVIEAVVDNDRKPAEGEIMDHGDGHDHSGHGAGHGSGG
ncbi:copper chaperone PCu(A)C [Paragemmobacter ruber]|uniref:Copper chaperone PCu(A)C n=1 Tax=Paragemmobacter ruber TaxID=1985673 RepID=A0ABW9Y620_9RHOB|nr:copper chaperone PCu(A)C [Rhodobacter ruber]NBE07975.1 copper chaperone PCu(A)C [Rhodobacter ruber]